MKSALFSGSFDPVTLGHADIIKRAAAMFDTLYVTVFANSEKHCLFTPEERLELLKTVCADIPNVKTDVCDGTVADYVIKNDIDVIIKGIRNSADAEYEMMIADVNSRLCGRETMMIAAAPEYSRISSTVIREMIKYGRPTEPYVGHVVAEKIDYLTHKQGAVK